MIFLLALALLIGCAASPETRELTYPNLAMGAEVSASTAEGYDFSPQRATDGDLSTRWSSKFFDPQWIMLDFGQKVNVQQVVIHWETAHGEQYSIETSQNGKKWEEVFYNDYNQGGENVITLDEPIPARYLRLTGITRATQWGYSVYELEVYDHPFTEPKAQEKPEYTREEGWKLVWSDEFDGPEINKNNWTHEIGRGDNGWGNNELQYYTDKEENSRIITDQEGNSVLMIEAREDEEHQYTSARMITQDKQFFQFGKVEARIKLPFGQGIWPAFWMLGQNFKEVSWPYCGEIDIMEMVGGEGNGRDNTIYGTIHYADESSSWTHSGGMTKLREGIMADDYHIISIEWYPDTIKWFLDGVLYHQEDISTPEKEELRKEFFLLLNVAVGGNWPGYPDETTKFPQRMLVDYVRVYKDVLE